jgi:hypothetical protein
MSARYLLPVSAAEAEYYQYRRSDGDYHHYNHRDAVDRVATIATARWIRCRYCASGGN